MPAQRKNEEQANPNVKIRFKATASSNDHAWELQKYNPFGAQSILILYSPGVVKMYNSFAQSKRVRVRVSSSFWNFEKNSWLVQLAQSLQLGPSNPSFSPRLSFSFSDSVSHVSAHVLWLVCSESKTSDVFSFALHFSSRLRPEPGFVCENKTAVGLFVGRSAMSTGLSCLLGRGLAFRQGIQGVCANHGRRWLCSSTGKSGEGKAAQPEAESGLKQDETGPDAVGSSVATRSPDILEAVRNFKPPNADDYGLQKKYVEDETGLDYPGGNFSKSLAYQMSVREAFHGTQDDMMHNKKLYRLRATISTSVFVFIMFAFFIVPGEEEIDEVTGDVYREPPGWVGVVNDYRRIKAYFSMSKEKPKLYVWKPS